MQLEYLVISFSPAISTQMFSYHRKNVHSHVKADDPNRFFSLFKTHLLSKVIFTCSKTFSQPLKQPKFSRLGNWYTYPEMHVTRPGSQGQQRSIIIIIVVVVVDDDAYYWVYLSSDHLFQVYYKVRQLFYYKVRRLLESATLQCIFQTGNFVSAFTTNYAFFRQSIMQFVNLI